MRKRLLLKLGLVALLGTGLFVAWLSWTEPRTGICRYTVSRIRPGMTREEVTEVIGLTDGWHGSGWDEVDLVPDNIDQVNRITNGMNDGDSVSGWMCRNGGICVLFDGNSKVVFAYYCHPESLLDKVRFWLHPD